MHKTNWIVTDNYNGPADGYCATHNVARNKCRKAHGDFSLTPYREARSLHLANAIREALEDMLAAMA